jgi:hypothetical protein
MNVAEAGSDGVGALLTDVGSHDGRIIGDDVVLS